MPLQQQNVVVPLSQGVSTKMDPKQVPLGKLLKLENGFFQTPMEIRKRFGFAALGSSILGGGTLDETAALFTLNDRLVAYVSSNATASKAGRLYSYDDANSLWVSIGPFVATKLTTDSISTSNIDQSYPDMDYDPVTGLQCFAWTDAANALHVNVVDASTDQVVYTGTIDTSITSSIRVLLFNSNFVIIYSKSGGGGSIQYQRIATSAPSTIAGTGTINSSASVRFDAVVLGTKIFIAYGGISIRSMDTSWVVSSATTSGAVANNTISICSDGSTNLGVAVGAAASNAAVFNSSLSVVLATTTLTWGSTVNQIGVCYVGGSYHVYGSNDGSNVGIKYARFTTASVTTAATECARQTNLSGKPFVYNGQIFFFGSPVKPTFQPTLFLYTHYFDCDDSYPSAVVGKIAYSTYVNSAVNPPRTLPQTVQISAGVFQTAYSQQTGIERVNPAALGATSPLSTWRLTADMTVTPSSAEIANGLHIAGGQLWLFDGMNIVEHGFHMYPTMTATATGVGTFPDGIYEYVAVYEWTDAAGQIHRSAPSPPVSVTMASNASIALAVSPLYATNKRGIATTGAIQPTNAIQVCFYRTAVNGTILYFVASVDNDITSDSLTYSDTTTDATNISNVQVYTTGGQVPNTAAPACLAVTTYKSRLIVVPSDNPNSWWFSQEVLAQSEATQPTPVELSDLFIKNIDQRGGPLTGVATMDSNLVFFKKDLPYYIVGNGPSSTGANDDFSSPQPITCPVGSTSQSSIVSSPFGILFQASNSAGIWLLDRSLSANYIGDDVEAYNTQSITSAVAYPTYNQVRFSLSGGSTLAYDYYVKQWTVMTGTAAIQSVLWQGLWTYSKSNGAVWQEDPTVHTDAGAFVQMKIGTSWLKFAGLQGFKRIYEALILGEYESAHTLNVDVFYDFIDSATQSTAITTTSSAPYQWRLLFKRQKCEAMKIELYDTEIAPAEAMRLSAISMLVGIKRGLNKMSASRTFD